MTQSTHPPSIFTQSIPLPGQGSRVITKAPASPDLWSHLPPLACVGPYGLRSAQV